MMSQMYYLDRSNVLLYDLFADAVCASHVHVFVNYKVCYLADQQFIAKIPHLLADQFVLGICRVRGLDVCAHLFG